MQATLSQSNDTRGNFVSLGQNHGYRFEGDRAILNAELAIGPLFEREVSSARDEHWALQLWACETPHQGGPLRGIKVAEAALGQPRPGDHDYLEASAFAQLPPAQRAYSMVLVLASGSAGTYDQVHDFSNYPARQQFAAPHLEGSVGYRFEEDAVVLQAEGLRNPRDTDNLSGSLSLQLWALREPYAGGAFEGVLLGSAELDRLVGQGEQRAIERRVARREAPEGEWQLALMLREWTEVAGYLTRDFCNFAELYRVGDGAQRNVDTEGAEERARLADLARVEEAARAELAAREAEVRVREEDAARALESARREEEAARASESARDKARLLEIEAAARAAMAVRAGTPTPVAKGVRGAQSGAKTTVTAASSPAKKVSPQAVVAPPAVRSEVVAHPANAARVSVQTASVDELASVPGLNKKLAVAIVRARPLTSLDELRQVRGIGDKMLQQLRTLLTL